MIVGIIIALLFLLINYAVTRKFFTPVMVFNVIWIAILFVNLLNFYKFYQFSGKSVAIIALGLLVFNVTYLICQNIFDKKYCGRIFLNPFTNRNKKLERIVNKKIIIFLQCSITFFLGILFFRMLPYLQNNGLLAVRTIYTANLGFMTTFERYFYIHFIVFPLNNTLLILLIIFWIKKNIFFKHLILTLFDTVLISLISGGRMALFNSALYFVIIGILGKKTITKLEYKKKRQIILLVLIASGAYVLFNTSQRNLPSNELTLIDNIIIYFSGGSKIFDVALKNPNSFGLNNFMYGSCFFAGLLSFILVFIQYTPIIGSIVTDIPTTVAQTFLNANVSIAPDLSMNAFGTMYYYFMRDFGIIGVVIFTSIFAIISYLLYKRMLQNDNAVNIYLTVNIFIVIIYSVCWWEPFRIEFWTPILHLLWVLPVIRGRRAQNENFASQHGL